MSKNDLCAEWVWIIQWILHFWIWDWEMRWRLQRKVLPLEALQMRVLLFVWFLSCSREAGKAGQGHKVMESGLLWSTVGHSNEADVFFSFIPFLIQPLKSRKLPVVLCYLGMSWCQAIGRCIQHECVLMGAVCTCPWEQNTAIGLCFLAKLLQKGFSSRNPVDHCFWAAVCTTHCGHTQAAMDLGLSQLSNNLEISYVAIIPFWATLLTLLRCSKLLGTHLGDVPRSISQLLYACSCHLVELLWVCILCETGGHWLWQTTRACVGRVWAPASRGSSVRLANTSLVLAGVPAHCIRASNDCSGCFLFTARLKDKQQGIQRPFSPPWLCALLFLNPLGLYTYGSSSLKKTFKIMKSNHQPDLPRNTTSRYSLPGNPEHKPVRSLPAWLLWGCFTAQVTTCIADGHMYMYLV